MSDHETPPEGEKPVAQHRLLAAIVFTDAVGFSKLAGKDEQAAFKILQRDFNLMTEICHSHGGRVLNTMGDGMLMVFGSAVEAMQCALKIQQSLYVSSRNMPAVSVLMHRLGVHMGDVIIDGENVFGDGVNVAARLQAECKPGAICYSRMVGDVIKHKVPVKARFLGAKHLKNIAEPVPVYEVPPLSEFATDNDPLLPSPSEQKDGVSGARAGVMLALVGGLLLALAVIIIWVGKKPVKSTIKDLDSKHSATVRPSPTSKPSPSPTATATAQPTGTPTPPTPAPQPNLEEARSRYDFTEMLRLLGNSDPARRETIKDLVDCRAWLEAELAATSPTNPLIAKVDGGDTKIYVSTRGLMLEGPSGVKEAQLISLPPATWLAMIEGAVKAPPTGTAAPYAANRWMGSWRAEFGL
ncbi:MAG: adenylate/guanylate cyclase domain-containing protein [Armatimonadetes bacterium]|nr:adenylate/guanylate cyclase domain-containing protein [Armatimonadota bacterium]